MLSIVLQLIYNHVKYFCDLKLHYDLVVCGTLELCYFLAYMEHFSI